MRHFDPPLRTKLAPPRLQRRILPRPELDARLREALDYRVTIVQAGTGYGKTTALAAFQPPGCSVFWYSLEEADTDPQRFLSHLLACFATRLPGLSSLPQALLQEIGDQGGRAAWNQALDALLNSLAETLQGPALLVLDDYHCVADSAEIVALSERLVAFLPEHLHLILATRHPLNCPALVRWRARGEVLEIDRQALAFSALEIEQLFRQAYGMRLPPAEVATLAERTEGWPIALQLVWQGLRNGSARSAADLLAQGPESLAALFDYLARELYARQSPEVAAFLTETAVLRELTPAACEAVRDRASNEQAAADEILRRLHDQDLFVLALGERHYRYHQLFHEFLRQQAAASPAAVRERHRRAARFFAAAQQDGEQIFHLLGAGDMVEASQAIARVGEATLFAGRQDTLAAWIAALPAELVAEQPRLQALLGDVFRLRSRFAEALEWYAHAEHAWRLRGDLAGAARALRGRARVYLDTVRPAEAERVLEEAQHLLDGSADREARARLLELLAENTLNMGRPDQAERLRAEAWTLRAEGPGEDVVSVRVKLRTGRLHEAQRILESWESAERQEAARGQNHAPRAHRETVLLLSLIHAFRGQAERAFELASQGIALGERLDSPFVTAVGHTRLAHAWQLRQYPPGSAEQARAREEALRCYQTSIAIGDRLAVRRIRLEAMWGITRAHGFAGDLSAAERAAAEGVEVGHWSGDFWVQSLVELALAASYVLAGRLEDGLALLTRLLVAFRECSDRFGSALVRLWLSLVYLELGETTRCLSNLDDLLAACEHGGYEFLFSAATLLGPPDPRRLVPLLILARQQRCRPAYTERLLALLGLSQIETHPGYQLRVQTLGGFRVWRGEHEIEPREWQRDKARQLFQLLLGQHGMPLQRDEIADRLWPHLAPDAAGRDFKVALSALNRALEPARAAEAPFAYIAREGSAYRLRPGADIWIDAAAFQHSAESGLQLSNNQPEQAIEILQNALALYSGEYLPDALYEDWAAAERERLLSLYLRAADTLAGLYLQRDDYHATLDLCSRILSRDPCWERAYRLMMRAHDRLGNRPQALRIYQRCVTALNEHLGVEPSDATTTLYRQITGES